MKKISPCQVCFLGSTGWVLVWTFKGKMEPYALLIQTLTCKQPINGCLRGLVFSLIVAIGKEPKLRYSQ